MMMVLTIRMDFVLWKLKMAQPPCRDCECKHWRQQWAGLQRTPTTPQISKPPPRSPTKPRDTPNPLHPISHPLEVNEWSLICTVIFVLNNMKTTLCNSACLCKDLQAIISPWSGKFSWNVYCYYAIQHLWHCFQLVNINRWTFLIYNICCVMLK